MAGTLNERFIEIVERMGDKTAFMAKRGGSWESYSFNWGMQQVRETAFALRTMGYEPGTRIAILSENRPEWATTDFGALASGMITVPLYTTLIPEQIAYILNDAEAKVIFVSTMDHLETVLSIREQVPSLEKVIVFYPEDLHEDDVVFNLDSFKAVLTKSFSRCRGASNQPTPSPSSTPRAQRATRKELS